MMKQKENLTRLLVEKGISTQEGFLELTQLKKLGAGFLLIVTAFFWGITFTLVKEAIGHVDVFVFLSQRFLMAFLILFPVCLFQKRRLTFKILKQGALLGIFLFSAYAFQTIALKFTTASNTGFLTGLNVVFVPLIGSFLFGQYITKNLKRGVLLATLGLLLLCTNGSWTINLGDLLAILCAVCVAWHLILTGEFAPTSDVYWLTTLQVGIVALSSILATRWSGHTILVWYSEIIWSLVICVLFATILAFLVQTSMQRFISPSQTALIFCMEPVFAALYAYWAAHERLGFYGLIGAILIMAGIVLSQISSAVEPSRKHSA
jgi:drug/metabolite transporter (DMT)-like permease